VNKKLRLSHQDVSIRIVRVRDAKKLQALVLGNRQWLKPWEATNPYGPNSFNLRAQIKALRQQLVEGQGLPFVIEYSGKIVGQLNVSNILFGSVGSAILGYWIIPEVAGKSITPKAVALVTDYLINVLGLHRVEIDIRPENKSSLRVVEKLGFRYEGIKQRFIHINGDWRDHFVFALTAEELSAGLMNQFINGSVTKQIYPYWEEN
jgi:ribosomal-protein-alanine N-acetyltransferase